MSGAAELAAELRARAPAARAEAIGVLEALCPLDAPTGDPEALAATAGLLAERLAALGGSVRRHSSPAGVHVEARFGPPGPAALLLLGHYDTVWPRGTAAARPLVLDAELAHGPGVFDMRGGIAATLAALGSLRALGALERPLAVLFTADEESGSESSAPLLVALGREAGRVLLPEPPLPGGRLKTARKGTAAYRIEVRGRAAHAGIDPERGASAVHALADVVREVEALARPELGTTLNVGRIGGGSLANVVAAEAWADVDVRAATGDEFERLESALGTLGTARPGVSLAVTRLSARPPMERTPAVAAAIERAGDLAGLLGLTLGEGATGGASDGNLLAPHGVGVLDGLGPEGEGAHALDERISLASLEERTALLALLAAEL